MYLTDWSDIGECHENDADNAHRENGRIFKITYGDVKPVKVDLEKQSDLELARLQVHANEWYVRTARRVLQERAAAGKGLGPAHRVLREILATDHDVRHRLRAIWALYATGGLDEKARLALLADPSPPVRAWAVRLLVDDGEPSAEVIQRLEAMAHYTHADPGPFNELNPLVRLYLASAMQRVPAERRWGLAASLALDTSPNITRNHTLLIWYGLEPWAARAQDRAGGLLAQCPNLTLCQFIARRMVDADVNVGLAAILRPLATRQESYPLFHRAVLQGVLEAVQGLKRRGCRWAGQRSPGDWPNGATRTSAPSSLRWGCSSATPRPSRACDRSLRIVPRRPRPGNSHCGTWSIAARPAWPHCCSDCSRTPGCAGRRSALAAYNDPSTPETLLKRYTKLSPAERDDAIATLASRPSWASAMLDAIRVGTVPRRDVNTTIARQVLAFGDPKLTAALEASWGAPRPTAKNKAPLIARYKGILESDELPPANLDRGGALFGRICAQCHKLYGQGGDVGPDLTGSDRTNPDYILENVLDPERHGRQGLYSDDCRNP